MDEGKNSATTNDNGPSNSSPKDELPWCSLKPIKKDGPKKDGPKKKKKKASNPAEKKPSNPVEKKKASNPAAAKTPGTSRPAEKKKKASNPAAAKTQEVSGLRLIALAETVYKIVKVRCCGNETQNPPIPKRILAIDRIESTNNPNCPHS